MTEISKIEFQLPEHTTSDPESIFRNVQIICSGGRVTLTPEQFLAFQQDLTTEDGAKVLCPQCQGVVTLRTRQ